MNRLYYGDNLDVLRDTQAFPDESVDLEYLDPPFNSKRDYNLLFKSPKTVGRVTTHGEQGRAASGDAAYTEAQITAFEDSWHWGDQAEREFDELLHQRNTDVAQMMKALRAFLGENDMMAYLTMMANRLLELHRVLKPTGSLYLHCDPTASHYLKIVLDGVFGKEMFRNEIIWQRTRLPYPTQKPQALLERIISASSDPGGVVLDPFCGCGTAVHAAQKLNRQWIGIDITHLAISLIEKRLKDAFPDLPDGTKQVEFEVHGTPKDLESARDFAKRDKYQFQWWAVSLVEAQPFQGKKKGADTGIDGIKFFRDVDQKDAHKIVVSVKGGENLKADDVRSVMAVREREGAEIALFISLSEPTKGMMADAASAGFYESANGRKFPRVQLLTIEGLLSKRQRAEHPDYEPALSFKKARQEAAGEQKKLL